MTENISIKKELNSLFKSHLVTGEISIASVRGGYNCRLYKITDKAKHTYLVKEYISNSSDHTDRLSVEFGAFSFLWKHGIRSVPRPILKVPGKNIGVYSFLHGKKFRKRIYSHSNIVAALQFWKKLHNLSHTKDAQKLPLAKDASFTLRSYDEDIKKRIDMFSNIHNQKKVDSYLKKEFLPIYMYIWEKISAYCQQRGIDIDYALPNRYRTLSPSDFGFHNALKSNQGSLQFYDFEYFGWDDPAKMIADFYLHPKMVFPYQEREFFYKNIYTTLVDSTLSYRLPLVYLLLSLKWCLIMLNVFLKDDSLEDRNKMRRQQKLSQSKKQLNQTIIELKNRPFPISLIII